MIGIVFILLCAITVIISIVLVTRKNRRLSVVIERGENNDKTAADYFCRLVCEMEHQMIIHDDGDSTEDTLYNNDKVVETMRARLSSHKEQVLVQCVFNKHEEIKMAKLADEFPRSFRVFYMPEEQETGSIHYKIIDIGKKAYLSKHCPGSSQREYELIDCSAARKNVGKRMFARLHREFDVLIEQASPRLRQAANA